MANLAQLNIGPTGQAVYTINSNPLIEPLGGPNTIADILDRFPEGLYHTGTDSRLYKFLLSLCGDSGAGALKKRSLQSRLKNEGPLLIWHDLDTFYANIFNFPRLKSEIYTYDPESMALEKQVWDKVNEADRAYQRRVIDFFHATRYGNSPYGIALAARSGAGQDIDVLENYRWIFDQLSDNVLGLEQSGDSASCSEFVIQPRLLGNTNIGTNGFVLNINAFAGSFRMFYENVPTASIPYNATAQFIEDVLNHMDISLPGDFSVLAMGLTSFEVTINNKQFSPFLFSIDKESLLSLDGGAVSIDYPLSDTFYLASFRGPNMTWYEDNIASIIDGSWVDSNDVREGDFTANNTIFLNPDIEHNMVETLDHLRPVGSLMTIKPVEERFIDVPIAKAFASSENIHISRFVTGNPDITWPTLDPTRGFFIQGNIVTSQPGSTPEQQIVEANTENEATYWAFSNRAVPVIYQTIDSVFAYRGEAINDPTYGTSVFYSNTYPLFKSEHEGIFAEATSLTWYSFLKTIQPDDIFSANLAIAAQNTPLISTYSTS